MKRLLLPLLALLCGQRAQADIAIAVGSPAGVDFAANGATTVTAGTGTCTPSTTTLGTVAANDIVLLVVTGEHDRNAHALTTANGFVQIGSTVFGGDGDATEENPEIGLSVWWRRGPGSAPVVTDTGDHTSCALHRFTGAITSGDPWDVQASGNDSNANDTSASIPGATTTVADTLVVLVQGTSNNATATTNCGAYTNADLASITEQFDSTSTSGLGGGHCIVTGTRASIGSYAASTATLSATTYKGGFSIALKPATTGDPLISSVQGTTTLSLTIPTLATSGSDRLLFVGAAASAGAFGSTSTVVRGGSESFAEDWDINNANHFHVSGHHFVAPATATASIVVTFGTTRDEATAGAIAFTGVDQTTPVGTPGTNTGATAGPATVTVSAADTEWLVDTAYSLVSAITVGADQASAWEQEAIAGAVSGGSSTQLGSVAGDVMSWSWSGGSNEWVIGAIPLKPVSGEPSTCTAGQSMALMGVGCR
jgi:hypothetical protein